MIKIRHWLVIVIHIDETADYYFSEKHVWSQLLLNDVREHRGEAWYSEDDYRYGHEVAIDRTNGDKYAVIQISKEQANDFKLLGIAKDASANPHWTRIFK